MEQVIKGFQGKDGLILLDYSGVANVPGAVKSIADLTAQVGDHFVVETVDADGKVETVKAVENPVGGGSVELDTSLTKAGAAADAGAVGAALIKKQTVGEDVQLGANRLIFGSPDDGAFAEGGGTPEEPIISFWGCHGDERVRLGGIAEPKYSDEAAPKSYVDNKLGGKLDKPAMPPDAAGKVLRVLSVNDDGTFVCGWADAPTGGVADVQIDGTSVVADGVANLPIGRDGTGVVNVSGAGKYGVQCNTSGTIICPAPTESQIDSRTDNPRRLVTTATYDYAVKAAMCDGKGAAWTADEQAAARARMGLDKLFVLLAAAALDEAVNSVAFEFATEVHEIYLLLQSPTVSELSPVYWKNQDGATIGYLTSAVLSTTNERYVMSHFYNINGVFSVCESRYGTNNLSCSSVLTNYHDYADGILALVGVRSNPFPAGTVIQVWGR